MNYRLTTLMRKLCGTVYCTGTQCRECVLNTPELLQEYIDKLIYNNVISHDDMLLIEDDTT